MQQLLPRTTTVRLTKSTAGCVLCACLAHSISLTVPALQWPGVQGEAQPPNAELLLYGGAAFERCLDEFREAARQLCFPAGMVEHV